MSLSLSVSLSVFVKCCGRVVVVCCGMLCLVLWCGVCAVWCVWCVVCDTLKNPCVHSTRPRVYVQYVSVCTSTTRTHVSTHGDVLNLHTEGVLYIHRGGRGSSSVLLTKICPHMGYHVLQRFTKETLGSYLF